MQQKKLSNELRSETSLYIKEELDKLELINIENLETFKSRISDCGKEIETTIEEMIVKFVDILDNSERLIYTLEDKLRKEPDSIDIDEINDEVDDIVDEFKEVFEVSMVPLVQEILSELRSKTVSLRLSLKMCVEEIINEISI